MLPVVLSINSKSSAPDEREADDDAADDVAACAAAAVNGCCDCVTPSPLNVALSSGCWLKLAVLDAAIDDDCDSDETGSRVDVTLSDSV